jgi:hypothetical protein
MKDFIDWVASDAPEWVRMVGVLLFIAAIVVATGLLAFVLSSKYWFVTVLIPIAGVWAVLREYKKSKE